MTDTPTHYSKAQRRLLTAIGGLGVAALAAAAFVLSYDDLRTLAIRGGAARHRAFLYPGILDGLVVVVILSILAARRASWWSRAVRWLLLLLLVAGAGAAGVERAVNGYRALPHRWVSGGVAAAPWLILLIAVWLWTAVIKQVLRTRRARPASPAGGVPCSAPGETADKTADGTVPTVMDGDIVPGFSRGESFPDARPLPRPAIERPRPLLDEEAAVTAYTDDDPAFLPSQDPADEHAPAQETIEEDTAGPRAAAGDEPDPYPPAPAASTPGASEPRALAPAASARDASAPPGPFEPDPSATEAEQVRAGREPYQAHLEAAPGEPAPAEAGTPDDGTGGDASGDIEEDAGTTAPRMIARPFLPTDVRLVGPPAPGDDLGDTQPDGIKLPDTDPDGVPVLGTTLPPAAGSSGVEAAEDLPGRTSADAAEDGDDEWLFEADADHPDAGDGLDAGDVAHGRRRADAPVPDAGEISEEPVSGGTPVEPTAGPDAPGQVPAPPPPSGTFRSSPTPPRGRG